MQKKIFYLTCLAPLFVSCSQREVVKNLPKAKAEHASEILKEKEIHNEVVQNKESDFYAVEVSSQHLKEATVILADHKFAEPANYTVFIPTYPNYKPCKDAEQILFAYGSLLYWMPSNENLNYALLLTGPTSSTTISSWIGTEQNPKFTWKPGWRVGAGYHTPCDGWDLDFQWTQFYSSLSSNLQQSKSIINNWSVTHANAYPSQTISDTASALWNLKLNYFQFVLEKPYYVDRSLSVLPYGGIKNTWVNQQVWFNANISTSQNAQNTSMKSNFWGIGPTVGLNSRYAPWQWLGLFADVNSAFYSGTLNSYTTYGNFVGAPGMVGQFNEKIAYMLPQVGGTLGIDIATQMFEEVSIYLNVGYEANYWWNVFAPPSLGTMNNSAALSVQGFTATARIDF